MWKSLQGPLWRRDPRGHEAENSSSAYFTCLTSILENSNHRALWIQTGTVNHRPAPYISLKTEPHTVVHDIAHGYQQPSLSWTRYSARNLMPPYHSFRCVPYSLRSSTYQIQRTQRNSSEWHIKLPTWRNPTHLNSWKNTRGQDINKRGALQSPTLHPMGVSITVQGIKEKHISGSYRH